MRIALAQINTTVGDLSGNVDGMIRAARRAAEVRRGCGGFSGAFRHRLPAARPGRKAHFRGALRAGSSSAWRRRRAAAISPSSPVTWALPNRPPASALPIGAAVLARRQHRVPADQDAAAHLRCLRRSALLRSRRIASLSCHRWPQDRPDHLRGRLERQAVLGAPALPARSRRRNWRIRARELLISINASPYHMGKRALRREIFAATARRHNDSGGLRQPGGRQRSTGVRRHQLRHGSPRGAWPPPRLPSPRTWCCSTPIRLRASTVRTCPTNARRSTRRWYWARATISASADFAAC